LHQDDFVILANIRKIPAQEALWGRNTSPAGMVLWTVARPPHSFQPP
jgi:hypothetical protein